jgi:predicted DNA-binding protein with PD1-like motif
MISVVQRLAMGADLRAEIQSLSEKLAAGVIISAVGSLTECVLRMAGDSAGTTISGPLEIVSITGTLGEGTHHVHLSVSDSKGTVFGGHLLDGCKVFTTVELVILNLSSDWKFNRMSDESTGYPELFPVKQQST